MLLYKVNVAVCTVQYPFFSMTILLLYNQILYFSGIGKIKDFHDWLLYFSMRTWFTSNQWGNKIFLWHDQTRLAKWNSAPLTDSILIDGDSDITRCPYLRLMSNKSYDRWRLYGIMEIINIAYQEEVVNKKMRCFRNRLKSPSSKDWLLSFPPPRWESGVHVSLVYQ